MSFRSRSWLPLITCRSGLIGCLMWLCTPASAEQVPPDIQNILSAPALRGQAEVRWLGLSIYDARLFTVKGQAFDWSRPFALELSYNRGFSQDRLISATGKELVRLEGPQTDHAAILDKLATCYKSVTAKDRFVAAGLTRDQIAFSLNGRPTCQLQHKNIRQRLLSIWVSDRARDPALSRQLRGL